MVATLAKDSSQTVSSTDISPTEGLLVRILDRGEVQTLEYSGAMSEHKSSLWWGTAVGYRAMQMAAIGMSTQGLWSRENLYIVSGHPGPGVLDSIDHVTHCRQNDRLHVVQNPQCQNKCNSAMKFDWWVSDGEKTIVVRLRPDFVGRDFYELADRLGPNATPEDRKEFEVSKVTLSTRIWNGPLEENFKIEPWPKVLQPGELPEDEGLKALMTHGL